MKNFKGTQGNWELNTDFREPIILNESGQVIFTHNKNCYDTDDKNNKYYSHNKMMANANLIANAPELLKVLHLVRNELFQAIECINGLESAKTSTSIKQADEVLKRILE